MTLPYLSGTFRAVNDPTLRFSQAGMAIASFTAVADKKRKDEASGEWLDDKVIFLRITTFKQLAEHVAESVTKGTTVIASGQVSVNEWETKEGEKRSTVEMIANDLGVSIFWDNVTVNKVERTTAPQRVPAEDPWNSNQGASPTDAPF